MTIIISNSSGVPIYEQIKEQIKAAILNSELKEGDVLPSIRQLARELKISVITTTRAYNDLQSEGFIANVQGKGCYVLPQNSGMIKEQIMRGIEEDFSSALTKSKMAGISKGELMDIFKVILEAESYE